MLVCVWSGGCDARSSSGGFGGGAEEAEQGMTEDGDDRNEAREKDSESEEGEGAEEVASPSLFCAMMPD